MKIGLGGGWFLLSMRIGLGRSIRTTYSLIVAIWDRPPEVDN